MIRYKQRYSIVEPKEKGEIEKYKKKRIKQIKKALKVLVVLDQKIRWIITS